MKLNKWIEKTGPKKVAKLLRVDPASVSNWKLGRSCPRPKKLHKIHVLSKGQVSYKEMVLHFV